jgi:hypothetical protein
MDPALVLAEYARRLQRSQATPSALSFPAQRPMVESTTRYDVCVTSRQSGKTNGAALRALRVALTKGTQRVTYITITRLNAKRLFWEPLLQWAAKLGINVQEQANHAELTLRVPRPDGVAVIELMGAHNDDDVEKFRGATYDLVIIDEAQSIRATVLELLMKRVLGAGLWARKGSVLMIGTPGPVKFGPFYDYWQGGKWQRFHWTAFDNPHIPEGEIAANAEMLGLSPEHPTYKREVLGQWEVDLSALVWEYDPIANEPDITLPVSAEAAGPDWRFSWGLDLGFQDRDALVVLGWRKTDHDKRIYAVDQWQENHKDVDQLHAVLRQKRDRWRPFTAVGDTGGHGAVKVLKTLEARLAMAINPKPPSVDVSVGLVNDDMRTRRLRIPSGTALAEDLRLEVWEVNIRTGKRTIGGDYHSDLTPAMRYAHSAAYAYRSKQAPPEPTESEKRTMRIMAKAQRARNPFARPRLRIPR